MTRTTGFIASNSGNQHLSNIPTPVQFMGVDVITKANTCNITLHNGSNANAAIFAAQVPANNYLNFDVTDGVFCEYGIWLEMVGGNASNVIVRYK